MAPKKETEKDYTRYLPTQALIVCDWTFGPAFLPLNGILVPLCGIPIVSYFLTFLRDQNLVRDVILLVKSHPQAVEGFIKTWRETNSAGKLRIRVRHLPEDNVGDVLRQIHRERVIVEDFFLLTPRTILDTIGDAAVEHARRRAKDESAILTKVLVKASGALWSPLDRLSILAHDNGEILHATPAYINSAPPSYSTKNFFKTGGKLEYALNVYDCHVDICAPEILDVFSENFDFQEATGHAFIRLLLGAKYEDELSDQSAYATFLPDTTLVYPIDCPRAVHAASMDLCKRKKEKNLLGFSSVLDTQMHFTILPHLSATTVANPGWKAAIKCSYIGANCNIHASASITRSILLDGVVVEEDAEIEDSIVGDGVIVGRGTVISTGSIIGHGVVFTGEATLPFKRLVTGTPASEPVEKDDSDSEAEISCDVSDLMLESEPVEKDDSECKPEVSRNYIQYNRDVSDLMLESESIGFNGNWDEVIRQKREELQKSDEDEDEDCDVDAQFCEYDREVRRILRSLQGDFSPANLSATVVEIKSYRMSCHETCTNTVKAMVPLIVDFVAEGAKGGEDVKSSATRWGPLIDGFRVRGNIEPETACIEAIIRGVEAHACLTPAHFSRILQTFCATNILSDEAILAWHAKYLEEISCRQLYVQEVAQFIEWLKDVSDSGSDADSE